MTARPITRKIGSRGEDKNYKKLVINRRNKNCGRQPANTYTSLGAKTHGVTILELSFGCV